MTIITTMRLIEAGTTKVLAGHHVDGEAVMVLRKINASEYMLHAVPITEAEQALRSILAADQAEATELTNAILATSEKPARKPRRRRKAKP